VVAAKDDERPRQFHGEMSSRSGRSAEAGRRGAEPRRHRLAGGERRPHVAVRQVQQLARRTLMLAGALSGRLHPDCILEDRLLGGRRDRRN